MTSAQTNTSVIILSENQTPFNSETLKATIIDLYNKGYRDFYTPLSSEFELSAAEIILSLNVFKIGNKFPNLNLKVVIENFQDHMRPYDTERTERFAKILDTAHEIILTRSAKYATHFFNATSVALENASLLLTCVDPQEMIMGKDDENIMIEDFPMLLTYHLAECRDMAIANLF